MKASAHRDGEEEDEPEAHQTEETRSWLQEYEMIRRTRISSFKRMKSRKLKDFIRRLAFLREKVKAFPLDFFLPLTACPWPSLTELHHLPHHRRLPAAIPPGAGEPARPGRT
jgi:hypothetical protein